MRHHFQMLVLFYHTTLDFDRARITGYGAEPILGFIKVLIYRYSDRLVERFFPRSEFVDNIDECLWIVALFGFIPLF